MKVGHQAVADLWQKLHTLGSYSLKLRVTRPNSSPDFLHYVAASSLLLMRDIDIAIYF